MEFNTCLSTSCWRAGAHCTNKQTETTDLRANQDTCAKACSRLEELQLKAKTQVLRVSARRKKSHCLEGLLLMETFDKIYIFKIFLGGCF